MAAWTTTSTTFQGSLELMWNSVMFFIPGQFWPTCPDPDLSHFSPNVWNKWGRCESNFFTWSLIINLSSLKGNSGTAQVCFCSFPHLARLDWLKEIKNVKNKWTWHLQVQGIEKWCSSIVRICRVRKHPLHKQSQQLRWRLPTGKAPFLRCQTVGAAAKYLPTCTSCVVSALRDHFSDRWLKVRAFNSVPEPLNTLKLVCAHFYIHTPSLAYGCGGFILPAQLSSACVKLSTCDSVLQVLSQWFKVLLRGCCWRLLVPPALYLYRPELCTVLSHSLFLHCHQKHWLHIHHVTVLESFRFEVIGTSPDV